MYIHKYNKYKNKYLNLKSNKITVNKNDDIQQVYDFIKRTNYKTKDEYVDNFNRFVKVNEILNDQIGVRDNGTLRIMTFNVHSFTNAQNETIDPNVYIELFEKINADVICLQECHMNYFNDNLRIYFENKGFIYNFCEADYDNFGNLILFKNGEDTKHYEKYYPYSNINKKYKNRCSVGIDYQFNFKDSNEYKKMSIINLHLEVNDYRDGNSNTLRYTQINDTLDKATESEIILMGDFNNQYEIIKYMEKKGYVSIYDFFYKKYNNIPVTTSLYFKAIDNIFIKNTSELEFIESYLYYTNISDHLPVIADLKLKKIDKKQNYHLLRYQPKFPFKIIKTNDGVEREKMLIKLNLTENELFYCTYPYMIREEGLKVVNIPMGEIFYKGVPKFVVTRNDNIENMYASTNSWYTKNCISLYYVNNKTQKVNSYQTVRNLKLFYLMDHDNIEKLMEKINNDIENTIISLSKIIFIPKDKSNIEYIIRHYYEYDETIKIKKLLFWIKVIKICTGYNIEWKEQLELIMEYFDVLPTSKLLKKNNGLEKFVDNETNKEVIYLINENMYSGHKNGLNKVSLTLGMDNVLAECIKNYFNIDGYISHSIPSLWHRYNIFHEEICLFVSRGALEKMPEEYNLDKILKYECDYPFNNPIFNYNLNKSS